jgi:hypothetical protein
MGLATRITQLVPRIEMKQHKAEGARR